MVSRCWFVETMLVNLPGKWRTSSAAASARPGNSQSRGGRKSHTISLRAYNSLTQLTILNTVSNALANPVYRHLLAAHVLSILGSGLITVALGLLAYELAGADAAIVLGIALTLKMVAYVGLAPVAAALVDRLPRGAFLVTLDVGRAGLVLVLPLVTHVWQIYVLVFVFQALSAAFTPTFQATIPDILTNENDYTQALSWSRLVYDLESLLSPVLAAALLSFLSFHYLFAGTAIGFLASAALVVSVTLPQARKSTVPANFRQRLTRGTWIYLRTPRLRGLLGLYLAVAAATAMVIVNTVILVKETLVLSDWYVALHFAAFGIGSMLVAIVLPRLLGYVTVRTVMLIGGWLLIVLLALAGLGPNLEAGLVLWSLFGAATSMIQTPVGLLLNRSCNEADRPALFAAQFSLSHACWLVAYLAAGVLGTKLGLELTFILMAVAAAFGVVLALRYWPADDPEEIEHEHLEIVHEHAFGDLVHHEDDSVQSSMSVRHKHQSIRHKHKFVVDDHHPTWPV